MKRFPFVVLAIIIAISSLTNSCQKSMDNSADITALKASVAALQKRTDSLAAALAATNNNLNNLADSVNSIKNKLTGIIGQISQLEMQITAANANISAINSQLAVLNQEYAELLAKLNAILAQLAAPCPSLLNGLIAYYPFTGNANDSSGNGNNGIVNGATLTTDRFGNANRAYLFNKDPDNIAINSVHETNILQYSISGWFQKNANSINKEGTIIGGSIPGKIPGGLRLCIGTTNQAQWIAEFQSFSAMGLLTFNQNYCDNVWHSFTVTFDAVSGLIIANEFKIYIDNSLVSQSEYSQGNLNNVIAPINNQGLPTVIGNILTGSPSSYFVGGDYFQGKIDEIRIYNRVLTQGEINYLATH